MFTNQITNIIIEKAINVHKLLGPGLLESVYQKCLFYELTEAGLLVEKEKCISVIYKNKDMGLGFRSDIIIEKKVIIELKTVEEIHPIHIAQIITYLKLSKIKVGLILNFNSIKMTNGIKSVVNNFY